MHVGKKFSAETDFFLFTSLARRENTHISRDDLMYLHTTSPNKQTLFSLIRPKHPFLESSLCPALCLPAPD